LAAVIALPALDRRTGHIRKAAPLKHPALDFPLLKNTASCEALQICDRILALKINESKYD
jgi:hypothetical protein